MNKILITYDQMVDQLKGKEHFFLPAEIHGYLTGLLCSRNAQNEKISLTPITELLESENITSESAQKLVAYMIGNITSQLADPDLSFSLLLPEDDAPIPDQIEALSTWCQHFLSGLVQKGKPIEKLNLPEAQEALKDISEISRVDYCKVSEENSLEDDLIQLIEHVRLCVILIYEELSRVEIVTSGSSKTKH